MIDMYLMVAALCSAAISSGALLGKKSLRDIGIGGLLFIITLQIVLIRGAIVVPTP